MADELLLGAAFTAAGAVGKSLFDWLKNRDNKQVARAEKQDKHDAELSAAVINQLFEQSTRQDIETGLLRMEVRECQAHHLACQQLTESLKAELGHHQALTEKLAGQLDLAVRRIQQLEQSQPLKGASE